MCGDCPQPRVLPDAVPVVLAYLRCFGQWNYASSGMPTGLRAADCLAIVTSQVEAIGITPDDIPFVMEGLLVIEHATVMARIDMAQHKKVESE